MRFIPQFQSNLAAFLFALTISVIITFGGSYAVFELTGPHYVYVITCTGGDTHILPVESEEARTFVCPSVTSASSVTED